MVCSKEMSFRFQDLNHLAYNRNVIQKKKKKTACIMQLLSLNF